MSQPARRMEPMRVTDPKNVTIRRTLLPGVCSTRGRYIDVAMPRLRCLERA